MNLASFVLSGVLLQIQLYADYNKNQDLEKTLLELQDDLSLPRITSYDFIVVGGGTAGCVLSGRLSEQGFTVLLLEEGGTPPPAVDKSHPHGVSNHLAINNEFTSMPDDENRITKTYAGKMLGGSGSHNSHVYNRGSPWDFDNWANITGDESWAYENVLQYFKKIENYVGFLINETEREEFYGQGGPLTVDTEKPPFFESWMAAGIELGFESVDPNGRQRESFTTMAKSAYHGKRESTFTSYIRDIEDSRESLTVLRYARLQEILIDDSSTAYGVAFERHGIPQIAFGSREIILSAGTYVSPLILIRSGVGPKLVLDAANIPIRSELPGVGKNLLDHVVVPLQFIINNISPPGMTTPEVIEALFQAQNSTQRGGAFLDLHGTQAFISSSRAEQDGESNWPDIRFLLTEAQAYSSVLYSLTVGVMRPRSVGEIVYNISAHLNGATEFTQLGNPDFQYFSDETDLEIMIEGIRLGMKVMLETEAFKNKNLSLINVAEVCKEELYDSDEFWECHARKTRMTVNHLVGTCKMGGAQDTMAVVDSNFRVKGIHKLRVVDASVMPTVTNANTNAPTIMIAEKASAIIIQEYN